MSLEVVPLSNPSTVWTTLIIFLILLILCIGAFVGILYLRERITKKTSKESQREPNLSFEDGTAHKKDVETSSKLVLKRKRASRVFIWRQNKTTVTPGGIVSSKKHPLAQELPMVTIKGAAIAENDQYSACRSHGTKTPRFEEPVSPMVLESSPCAGNVYAEKGKFSPSAGTSADLVELIGQSAALEKELTEPTTIELKDKRTDRKILYGINGLYELQQSYDLSIPQSMNVKTSEILKSQASLPLPDTSYSHRDFQDVRDLLLSDIPEVRCVGLFKLVALGAFHEPFTNWVHFQRGFCEVMLHAMGENTVYVDCISLPLLQAHFVELSCCYLWEQWYGVTEGQQKALKLLTREINIVKPKEGTDEGIKFENNLTHAMTMRFHEYVKESVNKDPEARYVDEINDKGSLGVKHGPRVGSYELSVLYKPRHEHNASAHMAVEVSILHLHDTFRLLCNLCLATPALARSVRPYCLFKLNGLAKACSKKVPCFRHREVLPLVEASINSTSRTSIKELFYDVFLEIVQAHLVCCILPADVFAPNSTIQSLVQSGLSPQHAHAVGIRERAIQVKRIVSSKYPKARYWGLPSDTLGPKPRDVAVPGEWKWSA